MKHFDIRFRLRTWFVAVATLALISCGSSDNNATLNTTQSTQAAVQQLTDTFATTLAGAQEVPPRTSGATGSGTVVVNANTRLMTATLTTTGIAGTGAHIHQAPPGVSGPIIFPLTETSPGSGIWTTTATLTEAQFNALRAGEFYFNVHSAAFPDGEIRGQIGAQLTSDTGAASMANAGKTVGTGTTGGTGSGLIQGATSTFAFVAALRGQHAVPAAQTAAQGSGTVLVIPATRQIIAVITTTGMNGTEAHIHESAPGTTGPIIIPLTQTNSGSGVWTARAALTDGQYNSLQAGNLYFDVHSAAFPNGEIRGQILPQILLSSQATGTMGNAGTPSAITSGAGTPTTGTDATGTGMTTGNGGIGTVPGVTGTGSSGIGTSGIGSIGIGSIGIGSIGIGSIGIGSIGIGSTGNIGTGTATSLIGTSPLGTGTTGTGTMTTITGTGTAGLSF